MSLPTVTTGTLAGHWKADAITGLSDGAYVTSWTDSSSGGHNLAVSASSTSTFETNELNGLPCVRIPTSAYLYNNSVSQSQPVTLFVVARRGAAVSSGNPVVVGAGTGTDVEMYFATDQKMRVWAGSNFGQTAAATLTDPHIYEAVINNASSSLGLDGTLSSATLGTNTFAGITVGAHGATRSGDYWVGDVFEVLLYSGALDSTDRTAVRDYLDAKWINPPVGPADRTLYAADPDTATTGLTAVDATASASTNATALAAQAAYVATNWGSGRIVLPAGDSIPCGPLGAWPEQVQLYALEGTILDFGSLTGTQTAVAFSGVGFTPAVGVRFKGPGKTSTTTGLDIAGQDLAFDHVSVDHFGVGVDLANEDTYIIKFDGGGIGENGLCVNLDLYTAGTTNSGERHVFTGVTFFNSTKVLVSSTGGGSVDFYGCSFDYCGSFGDLHGGHVLFSGCHFESSDTATTSGYLFDANYNSVTTFEGCRFILAKFGAGGLRWILNPAHGPANYGFGRVAFGAGNRAYFYDSNGTSSNRSSDELVFLAAGTTTPTTIESPFVHKWGPVTATPAWNDGTGTQAIAVAVASNVASGTLTLTPASAPVTNALPVRVQF